MGSVSPLAPHRAAATKDARWINACPLAPRMGPVKAICVPKAAFSIGGTVRSGRPNALAGVTSDYHRCSPDVTRQRARLCPDTWGQSGVEIGAAKILL